MKKVFKYIVYTMAALFAVILIAAIYSIATEEPAKAIDSKAAPTATTSSQHSETSTTETKPHAPNIISSVDVFTQRFNDYTLRNDLDMRIQQITITTGDIPMFKYAFNEYIGLIGTLNKEDKSIAEVTVIVAGEGDDAETRGIKILTVMSGIFTAINPDITPNERGKIIEKLGILKSNALKDGYKKEVEIKGVKYWITVSDALGLWFGASIPEN